MRRWVVTGLAMLLALAAWTAIVTVGTLDGWWRRPLAPRGDVAAFAAAADHRPGRHPDFGSQGLKQLPSV